jgi:hypothetical protein
MLVDWQRPGKAASAQPQLLLLILLLMPLLLLLVVTAAASAAGCHECRVICQERPCRTQDQQKPPPAAVVRPQ